MKEARAENEGRKEGILFRIDVEGTSCQKMNKKNSVPALLVITLHVFTNIAIVLFSFGEMKPC